MVDRIDHTKQTVRFYIEQLLKVKPEGAQLVRGAEVQLARKDHVCLKNNAPLPWEKDYEVLAFWKRQRYYFKTQLFQITKEKFGTPPPTPSLSEIHAQARIEERAKRWPVVQEEIETWLHSVPGRLHIPPSSPNLSF